MLMPKRTKYRKVHRGRRRGTAKGGTRVNFGDYGLQALDAGWITSRQIESARVAITRAVRSGRTRRSRSMFSRLANSSATCVYLGPPTTGVPRVMTSRTRSGTCSSIFRETCGSAMAEELQLPEFDQNDGSRL